jgi:SAM-dependent methyltransferase
MVKESDIRPQELFQRYLELAKADVDRFFNQRDTYQEVNCPGCGGQRRQVAFSKQGFAYHHCTGCGSLYNSPRPPRAAFVRYFQEADSVRFWAQEFYRATEASRRELIFKPRAAEVVDLARQYGLGQGLLVDLGSGYGTLLEEVEAHGFFAELKGVDCAPELAAACRAKGFAVLEKGVEELEAGDLAADLATCFEVLEHLYDPLQFLAGVKRILRADGLLLLTTLTCSGFDLRLLGRHSKSVNPPHHLNLLSLQGVEALLERAGFEVLELSTPGRLDVDIVRNALAGGPSLEIDPLWADLVSSDDENLRAELQQFLARHRLSSHLMVLARKTAP